MLAWAKACLSMPTCLAMCPVKVWKIPLSVASALQTFAESRAVSNRRIVRAIIAGLAPILGVYHGGVPCPITITIVQCLTET